jgi:hypothetical protein
MKWGWAADDLVGGGLLVPSAPYPFQEIGHAEVFWGVPRALSALLGLVIFAYPAKA